MPKTQVVDAALAESIMQNLFDAMPIFRRRMLRLDSVERSSRMPMSHVQVLSLLYDQGRLSVGDVSRRLGIAKPNVTPVVDKLLESKLVERTRDEQDRRVVYVRILPAGEAKLLEVRQLLAEQVGQWCARFSRSELKALNNALGCLIRTLGSVYED